MNATKFYFALAVSIGLAVLFLSGGTVLGGDSIRILKVRLLTELAPRNEVNPRWSPDGLFLSYEEDSGDGKRIWIRSVAGEVVKKIPDSESEGSSRGAIGLSGIVGRSSYSGELTWAPNGREYIYTSNMGTGIYHLYHEGFRKPRVRLTEDSSPKGQPAWSPDGRYLAFVSARTGNGDIYLKDLVMGNVRKITSGDEVDLYPTWSPDGRRLLFTSGVTHNHDIYVIDDISSPESSMRQLTFWPWDDIRPSWSPSGEKIAFYTNYNSSNDPRIWSIAVIPARSEPLLKDLSEYVVATNVIPDDDGGPAWSPDGRYIIYIGDLADGYGPIYAVDVEARKMFHLETGTEMNRDVAVSEMGIIAFRAQIEQWDHIFLAYTGRNPVAILSE
ncbi:MAG: TolB family protein [bacterium]